MLNTIYPFAALLCLTAAVTSCGGNEQKTVPTAKTAESTIVEALLGTWETVEVETTSHTWEGRDTIVHLHIKEADWARRFGSRPARTVYTPDGKFRRTYYNIKGQATDLTNGLWKAKGTDSLQVIEPNNLMVFKHELNAGRLTLTGFVDWDYDGEQDDEYRAVLRLVAKTD